MRVYRFRHIRAPRISPPSRVQACCRATALPDRRHTHREPRFALLCAVGLCCLASACGSAGHPAASVSARRAEQRGHRHPRFSARGGPHGRERQGRAHRDRPGAGALRLGAPRRDPRRPDPLAVPARAQRRGRGDRTARSGDSGRLGVREVDAGATYIVSKVTPVNVAKAAASWPTGLTNQGAGMKIGIIDDGVDQTHPTSPRPATRCPPASRRARLRTRPPR